MDLLEGIGERYLLGKANAAPQQVENFVKKQLKGPAKPTQQAAPSSEKAKDEEIVRLKKQLQATSLVAKESQKGTTPAAHDKKESKGSKKNGEGLKDAQSRSDTKQELSGKESDGKGHGEKKDEKHRHSRRRGRSLSPRTAIGAAESRHSSSAAASKSSHNQHKRQTPTSSKSAANRSIAAAQEREGSSEKSTAASSASSRLTAANLRKIQHQASSTPSSSHQPSATPSHKQSQSQKPRGAPTSEQGVYVIAVEEEREIFPTARKVETSKGRESFPTARKVETSSDRRKGDVVEVISDRGRVLYRY